MSPAEFRRHGHAAVDWVADYLADIEQFPVLSQVSPGEIRRRLPPHPPERPEPFETVLRDLGPLLLDGITHWQSPNFFAYFPANASGPSVLGELISAGLGVQGMLWATSPACTELEMLMLDWLVELCDLPRRFHSSGPGGGVIQDSASSAVLCAVVAARHRALSHGSSVEQLVGYTSQQAHSSVEKAARVAGLRPDQLVSLPGDAEGTLEPGALRAAVEAHRAAGRRPFFVAATAGTTSSLAFDPIQDAGALAAREGLWLHVDGAMAGSAAVCPELRWVNSGLEWADSYAFNPHKWLLTNFDCDCFWVADRAALVNALSILPEFLRNAATASGQVIDYRDWQIPLGRRFRALKLWFVMRHYGAEGLRHHIRSHVALAQDFASWVEADARFELAAPVRLSLVCFRLRGDDDLNQHLLDRINGSGRLYLSHTRLEGRLVLRMAIGATLTEGRHVQTAWATLQEMADLALRIEGVEQAAGENRSRR